MLNELTSEIPALGSAGTLNVYEFAGEEALSQLFSFDVIAASYDEYIPLKDLIRQKVKLSLTVKPGEGYHDRTFHGLVTSVTDWGEGYGNQNYFFYRMTVRPRLWLLSLNKRSRVFREKTIPEIVEQVLLDNGFAKSDYMFDGLQGDYPLRDQTVQHEETDLAFIRRLLEYEGIFFFFISKGDRDVIVFRDVNPAKGGSLDVGDVQLIPQVRLETDQMHVNQFRGQCRVATADVTVWDHDYEDFPSGNLSEQVKGNAGAPDQHGVYEEYDEQVKEPHTPAKQSSDCSTVESDCKDKREARLKQLAQRRREEVQANHGEFYTGSSNQVGFANGSVFSLVGWKAKGGGPKAPKRYMKTYLMTRVRHAGSGHHQFEMGAVNQLPEDPFGGSYDELFRLLDGEDGTPDEEASGYANGITCIELATPYRPPRETPWPRIPGVVTGKIEKHSGGKLLDEEGRYRVRMPFDPEGGGTSKGEPSRPVRMAQPYSGEDYGMHFPNHEDTEAVVAFIDGDVDRPVMLSTVPNPKMHTPVPNTKLKHPTQNVPEGGGPAAGAVGEAPGGDPVTFEETKNVIQTKCGHRLVMDDDKGTSNVGISLQVGKGEGAGTADPYWKSRIDMGGYRKKIFIEQLLDSASHVLSMLDSLVIKRADIPAMMGIIAEIIASQVSTGDYVSDTFGDTTPVGINGATEQTVSFMGFNGVNLVMPNLLGVWGAGVIPGMAGERRAARAIVDFVVNELYRDLIDNILNEYTTYKERKADPDWKTLDAFFNYEKDKKLSRVSGVIISALGLPAINFKSVGGINMTAFSKVSVVGGYRGIELNSQASMHQAADLDFNIESGQGIVIKAGGEPVGSPGFLGIVPRLADKFKVPIPGLVDRLTKKFGSPKPDPSDCNITILNENQDVNVRTPEGHITQKAKMHIVNHSTKGSITHEAYEGNVNLENKHASVRVQGGAGTARASKVVVESPGTIELRAANGKASIIMDQDGKIIISGQEVVVNGQKATTVNAPTKLDVNSKEINIAASAMAPGVAPKPPKEPEEVRPPVLKQYEMETPEPDASAAEKKRIAELNKFRAEENQRLQQVFNKREQAYKQYVKQLEQYHKSVATNAEKAGSPTASITLKAAGSIEMKANTDMKVDCLNYSSQAKVKQEFKGTLVDTKANGIIKSQGSLVKIN